ncbi:MAG: retropepsin-like aspartic protease family protein [Planktomarina sp.]
MGDSIASLIYLGILLVAISGWFITSSRQNIGQTLQMALIWGMIFMGAMAIYGLWNDISGAGSSKVVTTQDSITVPRSRDGHYYLTVEINGRDVEFLVDTGATDVVLTQEDAAKVGIDVDTLAFLGTAQTANGTVSTARTRLKHVVVGPFQDRYVLASVNGGEMFNSLLGMSYLSRFTRIEIASDALVLHR